jgi:tRNA 2-thiouridine synthesizing protein D
LNFALSIHGSPHTSSSLWTAYRFAEACLEDGHTIHRVFFYQDAVLIANRFQSPPQDEFDILKAWQVLARSHDLDLCLCIASCLRRGIVNSAEATRFEHLGDSLASGFTISGLGQLIEASLVADRTITFGA